MKKRVGKSLMNTSLCTSKDIINKTRGYAEVVGDQQLMEKLSELSYFHYHRNCKVNLIKKYEKCIEKKKPETDWHVVRKFHKKTFDIFCKFIDDEIIEKEQIYFLTDLHKRYRMLFLEVNDECTVNDIKGYTANKLEDRLLRRYDNVITFYNSPSHSLKKIVYKTGLDIQKLMYQSVVHSNSEKSRFENVAYEIRNSVKSLKKKKKLKST